MDKINAFILAAGFGERLRPITDHIPKPLLPILGRPVIETVLERISSLPLKNIGINIHYKQELLHEWVLGSRYVDKIQLFFEDPILGTGGALKNAEPLLKGSFFLVYNSDIISDLNLNDLVRRHIRSGNTATLAVHDCQQFNNVWIDQKGLMKSVGKTSPGGDKGFHAVAFMGIAVYSPGFLAFLPKGKSNVVDSWLKVVSSGYKVGTEDFTGSPWSDIGTPDSYSSKVFQTLKEEGETVYVDPSVGCGKVDMGVNTVIERGCVFEGRASARNCIFLPGAKVAGDVHNENAIIGPAYSVGIREAPGEPHPHLSSLMSRLSLFPSENVRMSLIGACGSDRTYYRLTAGEKTAVMMECSEKDPDYERHVIYTRFFRKYYVPVPELLWADTNTYNSGYPTSATQGFRYAVFEDLGDLSLYSLLKCVRDPERKENLYRCVLDILVNLHTAATRNVSECHLLKSRIFDYDHLRWETDYFVQRFVGGLEGIDIREESQALFREFARLATEVDSFEKAIVHRDFQSQNIMITKGDIPRIIDFQGARMGPPAYDVASVLWDPYFCLDNDMRERLLGYYLDKMKDCAVGYFDKDVFSRTILPCRLQRHMQALGAYGFLAKVKGKSFFLKHIPLALRYLAEEMELVRSSYPALYKVLRRLHEKTGY